MFGVKPGIAAIQGAVGSTGPSSWVFIEEVTSVAGSPDVSTSGDASGYISAGTDLENAYPVSNQSIGDVGHYISSETQTTFVFEAQ